MKKSWLFIFIGVLLFGFISCSNEEKKGEDMEELEVPDSLLTNDSVPKISSKSIEDLVQNISSPIEMASLIKETGSKFSPELLAPTDNIDKYATSVKRALALGIYGADLGYLNLYGQTRFIVDYLTSIKTLAEGIKVDQFFDFKTLKELATSGENVDTLMYLSVSSFNKIDEYLRAHNRTNISVLMITGVWIEGMYFATQINAEAQNKKIADRIAEQKPVLANLLLILKQYKGDKDFEKLVKDMEKLKAAYEPIEITYELGEPEMVEKDGMLVVVQNEKPVIKATEKDYENIKNIVSEIRYNILK
jgi:hypothetical protein